MPDLLTSLQEVLGERYLLEGELGRGGMATIYRARDTKHDREVAIKVLPPDLATILGRERFTREIAIAANLQHPHIVPLYDSGGEGDVLYFVMPLITGESLRDRLDRETQLPVAEALAIARDVADGLGYAHAKGVVHRDIKPENILLTGGRAMVADFGIARAMAMVEAERLTERGLSVGTPAYMSPEQCSGSYQIDGRADLYALGCVLYEMLAGEPPFTGRTVQAVIARHLQEPPPSLRVIRRTVSLPVQQAIETALAKVKADRYATASQFIAALNLAEESGGARGRWLPWLGAAAVVVLVLVAAKLVTDVLPLGGGTGAPPDTSRYAVLPFVREAGLGAGFSEEQLLHDALTRWNGIAVVDPFQVKDALARRGGGQLSTRDARRLALSLGAGRYVRGEVSQIGDSLRIRAALYDAALGMQLGEKAVKIAANLAGADSILSLMADELLFRGAGPGARSASHTGTLSVPARRAYENGHAAIQRWDLAAADSAFSAAAGFDPDYAQALLWVAVVRSWSGAAAVRWQSAAERAAAGRSRLPGRDQELSDALVAQARGDAASACGIWKRLANRDPFDFTAWYGLGNCLNRDEAVILDRNSPSNWAFRTSYHEALSAYERAFQLLPSMHRSLRGRAFESVRRLLKTRRIDMRRGRAVPPDTTQFGAYATWQGDTLAFIPYRNQELFGRPWTGSEGTNLALRHERERFQRIAVGWVTAFPRSPDALRALAVALEMLGDQSALDTLARARALASADDDRVQISAAEVWMRVRTSVPDNLAGLRAARALADSVLSSHSPGHDTEPMLLAGLAALLGRAGLGAAHSRAPSIALEWRIPAPLEDVAFPLLVFSAAGGPVDSIRALEQRADSIIEHLLAPAARPDARAEWLERPATLSLPEYQFRSLPRLMGGGDFLLNAQAAFLLRRDGAVARRMFTDLAAARRRVSPADVTFDAILPESELLSRVGSPREAIAWLDPFLDALSATEPSAVADPVRAAALVRAMVLRAELAERVGDTAAASRWARAVLVLWSEPDPEFGPIVRRMQSLTR